MIKSVYVVMHEHELSNFQDEVKFIGVFYTEDDAKEALSAAKELPGFCDTADGFSIQEEIIGERAWVEGFVTWQPPGE